MAVGAGSPTVLMKIVRAATASAIEPYEFLSSPLASRSRNKLFRATTFSCERIGREYLWPLAEVFSIASCCVDMHTYTSLVSGILSAHATALAASLTLRHARPVQIGLPVLVLSLLS